jgi:hypothetical protein
MLALPDDVISFILRDKNYLYPVVPHYENNIGDV